MTTINKDLIEAYETQRQRLDDHLTKMANHQVRPVGDRQLRVEAEIAKFRRHRVRERALQYALIGLAVILLGILVWATLTMDQSLNYRVIEFLTLLGAIVCGIVATTGFPMAGWSDQHIDEAAQELAGGREISPGQSDFIACLVQENTDLAPYVQGWLAQGAGRMSVDELAMLHEAVHLKLKATSCKADLEVGGYSPRLMQVVNEAAGRAIGGPAVPA